MSNKDMFTIAKAYGDAFTNGLDGLKKYSQLESSINKNWKDALTFNDDVERLNAVNKKLTADNIRDRYKSEGQLEFIKALSNPDLMYDENGKMLNEEQRLAKMFLNGGKYFGGTNGVAQELAREATINGYVNLAEKLAPFAPVSSINYRMQPYSNDVIAGFNPKSGFGMVGDNKNKTYIEFENPNQLAYFATNAPKYLESDNNFEQTKRINELNNGYKIEQMLLQHEQALEKLREELLLKYQYSGSQEGNGTAEYDPTNVAKTIDGFMRSGMSYEDAKKAAFDIYRVSPSDVNIGVIGDAGNHTVSGLTGGYGSSDNNAVHRSDVLRTINTIASNAPDSSNIEEQKMHYAAKIKLAGLTGLEQEKIPEWQKILKELEDEKRKQIEELKGWVVNPNVNQSGLF